MSVVALEAPCSDDRGGTGPWLARGLDSEEWERSSKERRRRQGFGSSGRSQSVACRPATCESHANEGSAQRAVLRFEVVSDVGVNTHCCGRRKSASAYGEAHGGQLEARPQIRSQSRQNFHCMERLYWWWSFLIISHTKKVPVTTRICTRTICCGICAEPVSEI